MIPQLDGLNLSDEVQLAIGLAFVLAGIGRIAWCAVTWKVRR